QPCRAHDRVAIACLIGDLDLAGKLRPAIGRERLCRVGLQVRLALRPVEDVVAGDVNRPGARRRGRPSNVPGASAVDLEGFIEGGLGAVDVRPARAVDYNLGTRLTDHRGNRLAIGDVEL